MWQVMKEVFNAEGVLILREVQADNVPEREAVEIAASCNYIEEEAPTYADLEPGTRIYYYPQAKTPQAQH